MAGGWYKMHRGWQDDPLFAGEPFSRRDAWEWLIAEAAYEAHTRWFKCHKIDLARGELATSERELCEAWRWERQRVRTFLRHLETDEKLTRHTTDGVTKLSISNYARYQSEEPSQQPTGQPAANPELTQSQPTIEEGKEGLEGKEEKNEGARFAFFGRVIRLTPRDLEEWQRAFHAIPDFMAELSALDTWFEAQSDAKRKAWFHTAKGALNRKHQEIIGARREIEEGACSRPIC